MKLEHWLNKIFPPVWWISKFYPWRRNLLFPGEEEFLAELAENKKKVLEIGTFEGASAEAIADTMNYHGKLVLVDPLTKINKHVSARPKFLEKSIHECLRWVNEVKFFQLYSTDPEVQKELKKMGKFDFIFIDGDHSYEGVEADFELAAKLLSKRGIIAFHDARRGDAVHMINNGGHIGSTNFVRDLLVDQYDKWEVHSKKHSIVVIKRKRSK